MKAMMIALAGLIAAPAHAADAEFCKAGAQISYSGATDGAAMKSIPDGATEMLIAHQSSSEAEARIILSAYLMGYSFGLLLGEPADVAAAFFSGCMSEAS